MIPESSITFAGSFLDRADALRTDIPQLDHHMADPTSRTLPARGSTLRPAPR